jgi:hypothetical protein
MAYRALDVAQGCERPPRMTRARSRRPLALLVVLFASMGVAQYRTARDAESGSIGTPNWTIEPEFQSDVFTFVRIQYSVGGTYGYGHRWPDRWAIDFPDSDLNFSYRLQQMTSLKVDPGGRVVKITDPEFLNYPFIYVVEPGRLTFTEEEIPILRRYLLNGGFLMLDDFWGEREWSNFYREIKRVFPEREPVELPLEHPIFHCVFDLKEKPQVPGIDWGRRGISYEPNHGLGAEEVHYRGISDDKGRLMVLICHNTDLGDGWEREGEDESYFRKYSEKKAYPMGINIVVYAMTH